MSCGPFPIIRITHDGSWRVTSDGAVRISGYAVPSEIASYVRLTEDGAWRLTESYGVRVIESAVVPAFDIAATIDVYFPGIVVQRNLTEAVGAWLTLTAGAISEADVETILALANEFLADDVVSPYVPTTQDDYPACLPPYPTGLPRFADSNPSPDGWSIANADKVVRG